MKRLIFVIVFLGICFLGCTDKSVKKPTPQAFSSATPLENLGIAPEKIATIDSLLQSFIDQKKYPNVTAFVAKGGNILYKKSFGYKDIEAGIPASPNDYYIWFSQTKAITSVAFMQLVEKGLVQLDDPVSKYFPEIPNRVVTKINKDGTYATREAKTPMTFLHLLTHTSGLNSGLIEEIKKKEGKIVEAAPGFGGRIPEKQFAGQRTWSTNFEAKYLKDEMMELVKYPLGFDPGTEFHYHPSTNMLAFLIERISGQSLREYVKQNVLEPLGMDNSDWYYDANSYSRFVQAYQAENGTLTKGTDIFIRAALTQEQTFAEGGLGLNGPIEDYAKFCQMLLNKGSFNHKQILKPETVELMTQANRVPEKGTWAKGFEFGLGFELFNVTKKPIPEVSDSAYAWGGLFGTEYLIDPENDLVVLFYINMFQREFLYPEFLKKVYQMLPEKIQP